MRNNIGITTVATQTLQESWVEAVNCILDNGGELWNLVVQIGDVNEVREDIVEAVEDFYKANGLLSPKHVAYTIFPEGFSRNKTRNELFENYNRVGGLYERIKTGWGTYFRRMTAYPSRNGRVNQINNIIEAINNRILRYRTPYTVIIQKPGNETVRARGGPCLNYLGFQVRNPEDDEISILAIYRNHDFLGKAYGNYLGLSNLLGFICRETGYQTGTITCVSSHAYIESKKRDLSTLIGNF